MNRSKKNIQYLLNTGAPNGEHVAYINDDEASILKYMGGSGRTDNNPYGIPSFAEDDGDSDDSGGGENSGSSGEDTGSNESSYGGDDGGQGYTDEFDNLAQSYITGRPSGSVPANSVNPTGRTTDQIVFDDNYNRMGSFGNLHHDLNPQGTYGSPYSSQLELINSIRTARPTDPKFAQIMQNLHSQNKYFNKLAINHRADPDIRNVYEKESQRLDSIINANLGRPEAEKEANDFTSKAAGAFGFKDSVEYDPNANNGIGGYVVSTNNFDPFSMPAVDLALVGLSGGVLAPYVAGKNTAGSVLDGNLIEAGLNAAGSFFPGQIGKMAGVVATGNDLLGSIDSDLDALLTSNNPSETLLAGVQSIPSRIGKVLDETKDMFSGSMNEPSLFGGQSNDQIFGGDSNNENEYKSVSSTPTFYQPPSPPPPPPPSPPVAEPELPYYQGPFVRQENYWDGNKLVIPKLVRRV
tara:strand:+ start:141 stop:1535 length:1395 start_codon:yes stop_codon:yes gene_type:complete